ncbi:MAG: LLM class flavin-dependent oxidoreductase, partial [Alphaproteobacteria bacterium]
GMAQADMVDRRMRAAAGAGGTLLVGDANSIADQMAALSASGIDGLLISWANFEDGLTRLSANLLPLLEARGLRRPFRPDGEPFEKAG